MNSSIEMQMKIRQNASEMQNYYNDMEKWEKEIRKKDESLKNKKKYSIEYAKPYSNNKNEIKNKKGDDHTYDKGYKKWENYDINKALEEVDNPIIYSPADIGKYIEPDNIIEINQKIENENEKELDLLEREKGNKYFSNGNFNEALKCYTRSLALNPKSSITYSNRAMAYLKLKQYKNAEEDCNESIKIDNKYVKSYYRRALAKNGQSKHRSALNDLKIAIEIDPTNKTIKMEINKTREIIKNCMKRVAFMNLKVNK